MSWENVPAIAQNGNITQYEVEYSQTTFNAITLPLRIIVSFLLRTTTIMNLQEFVVYAIRVRAYTNVGAGPYSDVVMETTQQAGMCFQCLLCQILLSVLTSFSSCITSEQCNCCQCLLNCYSSILGASPCH